MLGLWRMATVCNKVKLTAVKWSQRHKLKDGTL